MSLAMFLGCSGSAGTDPVRDTPKTHPTQEAPIVDKTYVVESRANFDEVHPERRIFYLNRHGGHYRRGWDDSSTNTSSILEHRSVDMPAFSGDDWNEVVSCVQSQFARWNVTVTEIDPGEEAHIEVVVGGRPKVFGLPSNVGGVAPMRRNSSTIETAIVFVFSDALPSANKTCEVAAHEIGHALGLEHAHLCEDPMTYLTGCGKKSFQDVDTWCGEVEPRTCHGGGKQNSVRFLDARLGLAKSIAKEPDPSPPPISDDPAGDDPAGDDRSRGNDPLDSDEPAAPTDHDGENDRGS